MNAKTCLLLAGLAGATAVAAGALGAHVAAAGALEILLPAVRFHMYHALALLGIAALAPREGPLPLPLAVSAWCFVAGILLFSGGLYLQAGFGASPLAIVMPIGGAGFIAGWLGLAWQALRKH
jgi:uncharacterized membrane protein YgdD (TMEM256/DUF423 family)